MSDLKNRYPDLLQFFAGYFHQDWMDTLPDRYERTTAGAVQQAFENKGNERLLQLQRVFRAFLYETAALDDEKLGDILDELGSSYYAPWDGSTYRSWLESIDKQLDDTIAQRMSLS